MSVFNQTFYSCCLQSVSQLTGVTAQSSHSEFRASIKHPKSNKGVWAAAKSPPDPSTAAPGLFSNQLMEVEEAKHRPG